MTRLLLAVLTWRLARRLAAPAIVVALAMLLLHSGSFARHERRHAVGAVERLVQPIEHGLQHALGRRSGRERLCATGRHRRLRAPRRPSLLRRRSRPAAARGPDRTRARRAPRRRRRDAHHLQRPPDRLAARPRPGRLARTRATHPAVSRIHRTPRPATLSSWGRAVKPAPSHGTAARSTPRIERPQRSQSPPVELGEIEKRDPVRNTSPAVEVARVYADALSWPVLSDCSSAADRADRRRRRCFPQRPSMPGGRQPAAPLASKRQRRCASPALSIALSLIVHREAMAVAVDGHIHATGNADGIEIGVC